MHDFVSKVKRTISSGHATHLFEVARDSRSPRAEVSKSGRSCRSVVSHCKLRNLVLAYLWLATRDSSGPSHFRAHSVAITFIVTFEEHRECD